MSSGNIRLADIIGERIRERRQKLGLTQKALAERVPVSPNTVISWEKGNKLPVVDTFIRLADALEVSMEWLCGLSEEQQEPIYYSTVVSMLMKIHKMTGFNIKKSYPNGESEQVLIEFETKYTPVIKFLSSLQDKRDALTEGSIAKEQYDTWIEEQIKTKLHRPIYNP